MLGGMAGAAGLAALPELLSALPAEAATAPGQKGLAGATVFGSDRVAAGEAFDDLVGRPACLNVQRVYFELSQWPAGVNNPQPVGKLASAGVKMLISFHPTPDLGTAQAHADFVSLGDAISLFKGLTVAQFEVALWHEANLDLEIFPTPASYRQYVAFYAPAVRAYDVPLLYIPGMSNPDTAVTYYPGSPLTDKILVDYYGNSHVKGVRLDQIMAVADGIAGDPVPVASAPKPFGVSEWGDSSGDPVAPADFDAYAEYLVSVFTGRLNAGKTNADIAWFDSGGAQNTITSPTDFKIPGFQKVYDALNR